MIELSKIALELQSICIANCPVRTKPPSGPSGKPGTSSYSPYPGNLQQNGINLSIVGNHAKLTIGGPEAPYGPYTETRSHKKGWIKKSIEEYKINVIREYGGTIK